MSAERVQRRLTAILAADVAGYSRLMGLDEAGTLARLNALRRELIDPVIWGGFVLGYFGEDIAVAITITDRCLSLNPSYAEAWPRSGLLRLYAGDLDSAIYAN